MVYRDAEEIRAIKAKSREAIALAMASKWGEAAAVNREIIESSPDDLDAWNRLGKALLEFGDPKAARAAFENTLTIDPANPIARKNVERLSMGAVASSPGGARVSHKMFIGESGKSAQVVLMAIASGKDRLYPAPGAAIELRPNNGNLTVFSTDGHFIGIVPPTLGRRLVGMIQAGNRYEGAIASTTSDGVRVVLRESYQHPSQRAKVSFPSSSVAAPEEPAEQQPARRRQASEEAPLPPPEPSAAQDDADTLKAAGASVGRLFDDSLPENPIFEDLAEEA